MSVDRRLLAVLLTLSALSGCRGSDPVPERNASQPPPSTFSRDIAPVVFAHCSHCHRPGQQSPLPLLNYQDVRRYAGQILVSMQRRTMPPWLPEPGDNEFEDARLLDPKTIRRFEQWMDNGFPEGAPTLPAPTFVDRWQLGEPDLVVQAPEAYTVAANGPEIVTNLVVPVPVSSTRYVRGIEFRPDNPSVVRHAVIGLDRTSRARSLDAQDRRPGYPGMVFDHIAGPRDRLSVWIPGALPRMEPEGTAWRLEPGNDLVIQMQLRPTGVTGSIRPTVGLFFSSAPPVRIPILIKLESTAIDILPGRRDYTASDSYVLPVDVQILSVYPHAHDLARALKATATLPDGTTRSLLWIKAWDSHWAEEYRYATPIDLPKGSTLRMEYVYDNSDTNMRNPRNPPERVRWGLQPIDEMGVLWLQVLPRNEADAAVLGARRGS